MSALGKLDYSIDSAKLTSSTGEVLEIKDLIAAVDIYESLLSPYIKCELAIADSSNFLEIAPIIGQEKIDLQITEGGKKIKRTFYVGAIANYVRGNGSASMYTMKLITKEQMMNSLMLVSQSYTGTVTDSITKIVKDYLKSEFKNIPDNSVGTYRVVIPNWNPFHAIEWLSKLGINDKQTPFAFYETLMDGFVFESYETMFKKKVYNRFVHKSGTPATNDADNQQASFNVAMEYDIKDYSSTYKNALRGTFGAGMHVVDIGKKNYKFLTYDYDVDFKKKQHLDQSAFLNQNFKVEDKPLNEYAAIHYTVNKNSGAFANSINNYNNEAEFTKLETNPYLYQLSLNKMHLVVRGRCDLSPGKIIDFEVDRDKPLVYGNNKDVNEYISGKYLVLNVHHKMISGKYVILMDVVRDSLGKKVKKR
jgi:hypothetical protein